MNIRIALALVLACAPMAACSTVQLATPVVSTANTNIDEKALAQAVNVYNAAAQLYLDLNAKELVSADVKAKVKPAFATALQALHAARTALAAANSTDFNSQVALALQTVAQASALLPKG